MIDPLFNGANIVPSGNVNSALVDDPKLNAAIEKAKTITDPKANAQAWADLDKQVTDQSYFVAWLWDNNVGLASKDVKGVPSNFNSGDWDLTFSSLKK
jgi:ABC-type transport system substrate-binding protein